MARRRMIYISLSEETLEKIDKMRITDKGEIPRAEFIEKIIEKALQEVKLGE